MFLNNIFAVLFLITFLDVFKDHFPLLVVYKKTCNHVLHMYTHVFAVPKYAARARTNGGALVVHAPSGVPGAGADGSSVRLQCSAKPELTRSCDRQTDMDPYGPVWTRMDPYRRVYHFILFV